VVLVVAGEFEQLPVEKSEICIAPPDQLFDLPQSEYPATKEVRRDALLTGRQAVPACSGGRGSRRGKAGRFTYCRPSVSACSAARSSRRVKRDALRTVDQPYRLALAVAVAEEVKRDALRTVGQPSRLAPPGAVAEEVKRDALRTCRPAVLGLLRRAR
jgi:hypothetical protein